MFPKSAVLFSPVKELGEFARRNGLIFIVNGAFSSGYVPTFMNLWNIDIFTFYGGYGLLGPKEACGFIASERAAEMLGGSSMREKYEMASLNMPAIAGLHRALEFVIQKKCVFSVTTAFKWLSTLSGRYSMFPVSTLSGGVKDRIPVISIQTDFYAGKPCGRKAGKRLGNHCGSGIPWLRIRPQGARNLSEGNPAFSFGYFTDIKEMERLVKAMWQVDGSDRYPAIRQQYAKRIIIYFRRNVMKETHYTSPYELEGRLPLGEAVLLGLQACTGNVCEQPDTDSADCRRLRNFPREIRCRLFCFRMP